MGNAQPDVQQPNLHHLQPAAQAGQQDLQHGVGACLSPSHRSVASRASKWEATWVRDSFLNIVSYAAAAAYRASLLETVTQEIICARVEKVAHASWEPAICLPHRMQLLRPLDTRPVHLSCAIRAGRPPRHGTWAAAEATAAGKQTAQGSAVGKSCSRAYMPGRPAHLPGLTSCLPLNM